MIYINEINAMKWGRNEDKKNLTCILEQGLEFGALNAPSSYIRVEKFSKVED